MKREDAEKIVDEWQRDEIKAVLGFAYGNFSGGVTLADADTHLATGCDHIKTMRPKMIDIIFDKFKDQP